MLWKKILDNDTNTLDWIFKLIKHKVQTRKQNNICSFICYLSNSVLIRGLLALSDGNPNTLVEENREIYWLLKIHDFQKKQTMGRVLAPRIQLCHIVFSISSLALFISGNHFIIFHAWSLEIMAIKKNKVLNLLIFILERTSLIS